MAALIQSATITRSLAPGLPVARIGERINPTGKHQQQQWLAAGELDFVVDLAARQEQGGAEVIGVNVGLPGAEEEELLVEAVSRLAEATTLPLYIDSSQPRALMAARRVYPHKPLVGSCTGEDGSYQPLLEFLAEHPAALVVMLNDEKGISPRAEDRLRVAAKVEDYARQVGFPTQDLVFDCLAMAVGADPQAGRVCLECIRGLAAQGKATIIGLSNVSYGMPWRGLLNQAFAAMAVSAGVGAVIYNPNTPGLSDALLAADVLAGRDDFAGRFLEHYRRNAPEEA